MKKLISRVVVPALLVGFSSVANSAVINAITGDVTSHTMSASNSFTNGPVSESGYTWTSTNSNSVYGYTGGYGLAGNGSWNSGLGFPYVGLNTASGSMSFTFDNAVSQVLAFINYAPNNYGTPLISIYDSSNALIESTVLGINTSGTNQGAYWGFDAGSSIISRFELSNAYIVAGDLQSSVSNVPVPAAAWFLGTALLGLMGYNKRKARQAEALAA